jgi:hypothetical protein
MTRIAFLLIASWAIAAAGGCASFGTLKPEISGKLVEVRTSLQAADDALNKVCPVGEASDLCTVARASSESTHSVYELALLFEQTGKDTASLLVDTATQLNTLWVAIKTVFGLKSRPDGTLVAITPPVVAVGDAAVK